MLGFPQENSWVQYEGIGKVIDLVKSFDRQCLLAKCDIEDALGSLTFTHQITIYWVLPGIFFIILIAVYHGS
jgi:hypothetical protein